MKRYKLSLCITSSSNWITSNNAGNKLKCSFVSLGKRTVGIHLADLMESRALGKYQAPGSTRGWPVSLLHHKGRHLKKLTPVPSLCSSVLWADQVGEYDWLKLLCCDWLKLLLINFPFLKLYFVALNLQVQRHLQAQFSWTESSQLSD